jgi:type VI secretion system protein ImpF
MSSQKPTASTRLAPPMMYAFREAHRRKDARLNPDEARQAGGEAVLTRQSRLAHANESELRAQLALDLDGLMNTTNFASVVDISELDLVKRSVLNFGLPDIVARTLEENRSETIPREIEQAILDFEPRILRRTLKVTQDPHVESETLRIRYHVNGEMACNPAAVPVEFVADLEVGTSRIFVKRK